MTTVDQLSTGQVLLTSLKAVNGNKIQMEIAEIVNERPISAVSLFNIGDDRFSQQKARRAWQADEPAQISKLLGIEEAKLLALKVGETLEVNQLNPTISVGDVKYMLKVRVRETTVPSDWQVENLEKAAKRKGKDGAFVMHNGEHIFSNCEIALIKEGETVEHVLLKADTVEESVSSTVGAAKQLVLA